MTTTSVPDLSGRRAPALGGFNLTALNLEIRRLRRNPRAIIITVIVPVIFFFAFGLNQTNTAGNYGHGNYAAWVLVSLALYGAIFSTTYTGAGVSIERAQGWSRQLRLTPLSPAAYIGMKVATALVLALVPITVVNVVGGILTHKASMPVYLWIVSARPGRRAAPSPRRLQPDRAEPGDPPATAEPARRHHHGHRPGHLLLRLRAE